MNRAERRRQERYLRSAQGLKDIQADQKALVSERELYSNAVKRLDAMTREDVTQVAYNEGYKAGVEESGQKIIHRYFAATMLALNDVCGFGQDRCLRVMQKIDQYIIECLTDDELVEKAQNKLKIEIVMDEGINRAQPM